MSPQAGTRECAPANERGGLHRCSTGKTPPQAGACGCAPDTEMDGLPQSSPGEMPLQAGACGCALLMRGEPLGERKPMSFHLVGSCQSHCYPRRGALYPWGYPCRGGYQRGNPMVKPCCLKAYACNYLVGNGLVFYPAASLLSIFF